MAYLCLRHTEEPDKDLCSSCSIPGTEREMAALSDYLHDIKPEGDDAGLAGSKQRWEIQGGQKNG